MPFALTNAVASISGCESSNFFSCECVALLKSISFGLRKPLTKHVATTGFMLSRFSLNDRSKLCTVNIAPQEFPQFNGGDILKSPHKVSFFFCFFFYLRYFLPLCCCTECILFGSVMFTALHVSSWRLSLDRGGGGQKAITLCSHTYQHIGFSGRTKNNKYVGKLYICMYVQLCAQKKLGK